MACECQRMTRNERCPLCGGKAELILHLHFSTKMNLPTEIPIRCCVADNFLFVAEGCRTDYDAYYASLANDTYHTELSGESGLSPISRLQASHLMRILDGFFDRPKRTFDFGCGEASLLTELASKFPDSQFFGYDPSPASKAAAEKVRVFGLNNLKVLDLQASANQKPFDLVIVSHVIEHLIDFDLLRFLSELVCDDGLLYIEVPDALKYGIQQRREFLYYFDRLHVNHFTPQSLALLAGHYGFGCVNEVEYSLPYRDGGEYPALGMLCRKNGAPMTKASPAMLDAARRYIASEQLRAKDIAAQLDSYSGILVWGAGDNFYRSIENGGPLAGLRNMVLLDRRRQTVTVGDRNWQVANPQAGIRRHPWPVVITVSEGRKGLSEQVNQIDPARKIFFI